MNNSSSLVSGFKILSFGILALSIFSSLYTGVFEMLVAGIIIVIPIYILASILQILVDIRDNSHQTQKLLESIEDIMINGAKPSSIEVKNDNKITKKEQ